MYNKIVKFVKLEEVDSSQKFQYLMLKAIRKPKTRKIRTDDAILMVMSAIDHNKSIISRTLLQREVFLFYESVCREHGISDGASDAGFFPYKYGPYSIDVNLALSALIVSGSVMVENYYINSYKNKRFLAKFITNADFSDLADKYRDLLASKGLSVDEFKEIVGAKKQGWDQSTTGGINKLLDSPGFRKWFKAGISLEDVLPNITFGKITEDYIPRGEKLARD